MPHAYKTRSQNSQGGGNAFLKGLQWGDNDGAIGSCCSHNPRQTPHTQLLLTFKIYSLYQHRTSRVGPCYVLTKSFNILRHRSPLLPRELSAFKDRQNQNPGCWETDMRSPALSCKQHDLARQGLLHKRLRFTTITL